MNEILTIFFTFYCDSDIRRKYIEICIRTLFNEEGGGNYPMLVVDASPIGEVEKNKKIFLNCPNVKYFHDEEKNPFKRSCKYFSHIKTDYVLRLLEDIAFNSEKNNFLELAERDVDILKKISSIDVVLYLLADDSKYELIGNNLFYEPLNFSGLKFKYLEGRKFYDHRQSGWLYHYYCHNLLYRKSLLDRQWRYLADRYETHNAAEAGNMNTIIYKAFSNIRYLRGFIRILIRLHEKIFHSSEIIKSVIVTETMSECDILHIGYARVEKRDLANAREVPELKNLRIFSDINLLHQMKFKRKNSNSLFG